MKHTIFPVVQQPHASCGKCDRFRLIPGCPTAAVRMTDSAPHVDHVLLGQIRHFSGRQVHTLHLDLSGEECAGMPGADGSYIQGDTFPMQGHAMTYASWGLLKGSIVKVLQEFPYPKSTTDTSFGHIQRDTQVAFGARLLEALHCAIYYSVIHNLQGYLRRGVSFDSALPEASRHAVYNSQQGKDLLLVEAHILDECLYYLRRHRLRIQLQHAVWRLAYSVARPMLRKQGKPEILQPAAAVQDLYRAAVAQGYTINVSDMAKRPFHVTPQALRALLDSSATPTPPCPRCLTWLRISSGRN